MNWRYSNLDHLYQMRIYSSLPIYEDAETTQNKNTGGVLT
jgi:hypothetical protein